MLYKGIYNLDTSSESTMSKYYLKTASESIMGEL